MRLRHVTPSERPELGAALEAMSAGRTGGAGRLKGGVAVKSTMNRTGWLSLRRQDESRMTGRGHLRRPAAAIWRKPGCGFAAVVRELLQDCLSFVTRPQQGVAVTGPGDFI